MLLRNECQDGKCLPARQQNQRLHHVLPIISTPSTLGLTNTNPNLHTATGRSGTCGFRLDCKISACVCVFCEKDVALLMNVVQCREEVKLKGEISWLSMEEEQGRGGGGVG